MPQNTNYWKLLNPTRKLHACGPWPPRDPATAFLLLLFWNFNLFASNPNKKPTFWFFFLYKIVTIPAFYFFLFYTTLFISCFIFFLFLLFFFPSTLNKFLLFTSSCPREEFTRPPSLISSRNWAVALLAWSIEVLTSMFIVLDPVDSYRLYPVGFCLSIKLLIYSVFIN